MGEVYRARDTKLESRRRDQGPARRLRQDPERLARFEREAQVLASLNHPNIAHIYGLEESDGVTRAGHGTRRGRGRCRSASRAGRFRSTRRCRSRGRSPRRSKPRTSTGIVHRDLKPANIKCVPTARSRCSTSGSPRRWIRPAGRARTASELADAHDRTHDAGRHDPRHRRLHGARAGARQGRRQARRHLGVRRACCSRCSPAGARSRATTITDTLVAVIVQDEPDWTRCRPTTPPAHPQLLRRCLEKDPKRRLRDIGDARIEIDEALDTPATETPAIRQSSTPGWASRFAGAVAAASADCRRNAAVALCRITRHSRQSTPLSMHRLTRCSAKTTS